MEKIVFTEEFCRPENLFPFTLTRQIQDIRVGILTIREKWEQYLSMPSFDKQEGDYKDLERAIAVDKSIGTDVIYLIHGNILPTIKLAKQVKKLKPGECLSIPANENCIYCISAKQIEGEYKIKVEKTIESKTEVKEIKYPWDIFDLNRWSIQEDFVWLSKNRKSQNISSTNKTINEKNIFIEVGAEVEHCFLNASDGPIFISKEAIVMEGAMLRGPVAIGEGTLVKMGAKIYGATSVGPYCSVGGEIKNSVFFGYSNKAHDGYLGDSVIGEWCNMGAGTSNSNIKNNASEIMVYSPNGQHNVGLKCGVMMGDYSRTAINTSINTGTIIGVSCNVYGDGLTPKYIPNFSWGNDGIQRYEYKKAIVDIQNWKSLKNEMLSEKEKQILHHIFEHY